MECPAGNAHLISKEETGDGSVECGEKKSAGNGFGFKHVGVVVFYDCREVFAGTARKLSLILLLLFHAIVHVFVILGDVKLWVSFGQNHG